MIKTVINLTLFFKVNEELSHSVLSERLLDCSSITIKLSISRFFQKKELE